MNSRTKKLTTIGILCAFSYASTVVGRIPIVLFLKYDPKDIIIAIGGLIYDPLTSFLIALIVSLAEMVTISENGILGCLMNIISSCSFAYTAAFIYRKKHKLSGAIGGLFCGWGVHGFGNAALELPYSALIHGLSERGGCRIAYSGVFTF